MFKGKGDIGASFAHGVDVVRRSPSARVRDQDGSLLLGCQGFLELRLQAVGATIHILILGCLLIVIT